MAKNVIFDSGYWFALYDHTDDHHSKAQEYLQYLTVHNVLIPWPSLYETINTKFVRNRNWIASFTTLLKQSNVTLLDDANYRSSSYENVMIYQAKARNLSLVDLVIREMLQDPAFKIHALITFNPNDFRDICYKNRIELNN